MKYKKINSIYLIRIDKDEKIIASLTEFIDKEKVKAGYFSGVGAVSHCTTKLYNYEKKEYIEQNFQEKMEITSLTGNIALFNGKPVIHAHINLGDSEMNIRGGHLQEAVVGSTCEIVLNVFDMEIKRKPDEDTGLNILDL